MDRLSMSVNDASALLGVSRATLYTQIRSGQILSFRVGGRRLISHKAIQEYIKECEKESVRLARSEKKPPAPRGEKATGGTSQHEAARSKKRRKPAGSNSTAA